MPKPHPKGPRVFRNLFEARPMPPKTQDTSPPVTPGIDLTGFAGRYTWAEPGFTVPPGFFSRMNAARKVALPPSFATHPGDLGSINLSTLAVKA